jgi:uncharacterized membrane protein
MTMNALAFRDLPPEAMVGYWINHIGTAIDISGVVVIVSGIVWATARFLERRAEEQHYERYKTRIGRSLLLGLEFLVAADIVKTIAVEPTFMSLGVLAGLVLVRTFLSWTLLLEVEGRWPWQEKLSVHTGFTSAGLGNMAAACALRSVEKTTSQGSY